jgi:HK97 family phage prohead protease
MTLQMCLRAVEFRSEEEAGDGRTLEGYAAVFDTPTLIASWDGTFEEEISRGAFRKSLRSKTPVLQFDHGRDARTGSIPIGKMEDVHEDDKGLYVRARLFDNPVVEPIRQAIEGGAIDGMSFRFEVIRDEWRDKDGKKIKPDELSSLLWEAGDRGPLKRSILEVTLHEAGPVVFPAYDATTVGVRSLIAGFDAEERKALVHELARDLRDHTIRALTGTFTPEQAAKIAADIDFTGRPGARSAGGGDNDEEPRNGEASTTSTQDLETRGRVLRALGVI